MRDKRADDDRLAEVKAALELLEQVKDDTFNLITNLQKANRRSRPRDADVATN